MRTFWYITCRGVANVGVKPHVHRTRVHHALEALTSLLSPLPALTMHLVSAHRADPNASASNSISSSSSSSAPSTYRLQPQTSTSSSLLSRLFQRKKNTPDSSAPTATLSRRSSIDSQTTFASTISISKSAPLDYGVPPTAPSTSDDFEGSNVVNVPTLPCRPTPSAASNKAKASHKKVDNEPRRAALLA